MKVIIIEDEPLAQQELIRLLNKNQRSIEIVGLLDSVEDSIKWLEEHNNFDLVFMDIQLSDGMSFDIMKRVKIQKPVIFTTAYDQYWMEAFKLNSIDYLLKPIEESSLEKALVKFENMKSYYAVENSNHNFEIIQDLLDKSSDRKFKSRFVAKIGERFIRIPKEETAYFYAEGNLVYLVTLENKKYLIEYTLDELCNLVNPDEFFRLNRTFLTHIDAIREVHKYFNGRLSVNLQPEIKEKIIVSRAKAKTLIEWLDQ
jgi:DNA-binding LytR/AlgR family response regulator